MTDHQEECKQECKPLNAQRKPTALPKELQQRIDTLESFWFAHGGAPYEGITIGEFLTQAHQDTEQVVLAEKSKRVAILKEIGDLVHDSDGVAGLHLNGDLAPWYWLAENVWLEQTNKQMLELELDQLALSEQKKQK